MEGTPLRESGAAPCKSTLSYFCHKTEYSHKMDKDSEQPVINVRFYCQMSVPPAYEEAFGFQNFLKFWEVGEGIADP